MSKNLKSKTNGSNSMVEDKLWELGGVSSSLAFRTKFHYLSFKKSFNPIGRGTCLRNKRVSVRIRQGLHFNGKWKIDNCQFSTSKAFKLIF